MRSLTRWSRYPRQTADAAGGFLAGTMCGFAALLILLLLWAGACDLAFAAPETGALPTLTTVGSVHLLNATDAARAYPVHLNAVITYYDPYLNHPHRPIIMVTDKTGSIYVGIPAETAMPLRAGLMIEVHGVSNPGDFGPNISHATVRILGPAPLPPHPPRQSLTHLLTGSEDAQWVEVEGVVKSVDYSGSNVTLKLALADGEMGATTVQEPDANYERLIDSKVLIHGIAGSLYNLRSQIFGERLFFPGLSTLWVEDTAPEHPFALPVSPIANLMTYVPDKVFARRVHLRGQVTLFWPGRMLCIEQRHGNGQDSMCADTAQTSTIAAGEWADVIGFPMIGNVTPTLSDATYQPAPGERSLLPVAIDGEEAFSGHHDAELVQMEGTLIAHDHASADPTIVMSTGKFTYSVVLPKSADARKLLKLEEGSRLRITGICSVQADAKVFTRHDGYPVAKYFQIMLRSSDDVFVLERPSWWSAQHTLKVLAFALAVTLAVLCWSFYLRQRVKRQTDQLRYQATHDGLTGLWNRKAVLDMMRREFEVAARARQSIGVMMLDADHFKKVNDTYGHLAGDAVLKELAKRIQQSVRSYDLTGRYGGEEFLVVLPGCTSEEVYACGERVRAAVADTPMNFEGTALAVTMSVGTAVLDPLANSEREALAAADGALYEAKRSGRNRVVAGDLKHEAIEERIA